MLDYLSRYTHRTAIGNERLLDIHGDTVRFRTRVNRKHPANDGANPSTDGRGDRGGSRFTTLPGTEFIHRLMQHVYPTGFKRICSHRHCAGSARASNQSPAHDHGSGAAGHAGGQPCSSRGGE